ncbi:MAG: peptidoglycan-binding domain-containing protein [Christensenellales bacterium]
MTGRKGLNAYTNGGDRKYFFGKPDNAVGNTSQKGWSDCSSACRAAIRAASGIDIGRNTHHQILNRASGMIVDQTNGDYPDESKLLPGDLLYFKGNRYHVMDVGHVEMYTGKDTIHGHGSGTGPKKRALRAYCKSRASADKRYFMAIRWIYHDAEYPKLAFGARGASVSRMQLLLIELDYPLEKYGADGIFGAETKAALQKFQKDAGMDATGECDAATWAALEGKTQAKEDEAPENPHPMPARNIARGARGDGVRWVQWELTDAGFSCGKYGIDGIFGKDTEAATLRFQTLVFPKDVREWDGIVGPKTRAKLIEAKGAELGETDG